jgi:hyaluronoglucosaminidase
MKVRGVIEGFYGPPWTHDERLDLIRFCGEQGFNTWVHAPKDEPQHRRLWRERYPDGELELLAELVGEASRAGVEFVYAIAPGLDLCYSNESEFETLLAKCAQLQTIGVRSFQLPGTTSNPRCTALRT